MFINNEPLLFTAKQIAKIESLRNVKYVCATEYKDRSIEVFYADKPHSVSGSRYFALYYDYDNTLMIADGSFIEEQEFFGVSSDEDEIIYSRHRHDCRTSRDGSVFIDGGRSYIRTNVLDASRRVSLIVRNGVLKVKDD